MLIQQLTLENFTLFHELTKQPHASLNVIIGENNTGKTHFLKLLYAVVRSLEEYQKKPVTTTSIPFAVQLAKKLQWVFLPPKLELGHLVSFGQKRLKVQVQIQQEMLQFEFGKTTKNRIQKLSFRSEIQNANAVKAIFLPAKEILSIFDAIIATREDKEILAYDDTYLDLVRDFRQPLTHKPSPLIEVWQVLKTATGDSEIVVEKDGGIWFMQGQAKYNVHQMAEGMRKIGILHRLMQNEMLTSQIKSVLFVDEPEINLHPQAQVQLADFLYQLSQSGIQIYLSTHNYFVLKRLEQLARQYEQDLLLINLHRDKNQVITSFHQLRDGLPANPIVEQSLALYQQDVELYLQKR